MLSVSRQENLVENNETLLCTGTVCRVYQDKNTLWRIMRHRYCMLSVSRQEHPVENNETLPCTGTVC